MNPRCILMAVLALGLPALLVALPFEEWTTTEFTSAQLADPAISGASADPEGDGMANLQEYAFFGQPLTVDTHLTPKVELVAATLALTYRERHDLTDLSIRLQGSDTLQNWITYNAVTEADRVTFTGYDEVTLLDPAPFSTRRFLRLRLELTPEPALRAPTQLALKVITPSNWSVSWTDPNTTETGYAVERKNLTTGEWDRLTSIGADTGTWAHTAANYQTSLTYRAIAQGADGQEVPSNPVTLPDTDGDGIPDALELGAAYAGLGGTFGSYYDQFSSNGGGLSDGWLAANGFDPNAPFDGSLDTDGDGLTDAEEAARGTNPHSADTDGDGVPDTQDGWPLDNKLSPPFVPETGYAVLPLMTSTGWDEEYTPRWIDDSAGVVGIKSTQPPTGESEFIPGLWKPNAAFQSIPELKWHERTYYEIFYNNNNTWGNSDFFYLHLTPLKQSKDGWLAVSHRGTNAIIATARLYNPQGSVVDVPPRLTPRQQNADVSTNWSIPVGIGAGGRLLLYETGGTHIDQTYTEGPYNTVIKTPFKTNWYRGALTTGPNGEGGTEHWQELTQYGQIDSYQAAEPIYQTDSSGNSHIVGYKLPVPNTTYPVNWQTSETYYPTLINDEGVTLGYFKKVLGPGLSGWPDWDHQSKSAASATQLLQADYTLLGSGEPAMGLGYKHGVLWRAVKAATTWDECKLSIWDPVLQKEATGVQPVAMNRRREIVAGTQIVRNGVLRTLAELTPGWDYLSAFDVNNLGVALAAGQKTSESPYQFVLLIPAALQIDQNRDGIIDGKDLSDNTASTPFRFWSNDDDDGTAFNEEQEITNTSQPDYESRGEFGIKSKRDLEDFARIHLFIGGLTDAISAGTMKIGLRWKEGTVTGSPAINLYRQVETDGGQKYLTDDATAIAQIVPPYSTTLTDLNGKGIIDASGIFILKPELFAGVSSSKPTYFLFEGAGIGKGMLQMVILDQNNNIIGEGPGTWIDLQSILSMYQRVKVTPRDPNGIPKPYQSSTTFDASTTGTEASNDAHPFQAPPGETNSALVFVHGSNIIYEEAKWNAETMFKRLYWQGYKGRFVLFYWDTLVGFDTGLPDPIGQVPALPYNLNEYRALKFGPALKSYVASLAQGGRTVNVTSHSLGAGVVLSALKEGMSVNNYLILQGAMSAKCYNGSLATLQKFQDAETANPTPDLVNKLGYGGYLSGVNGTVINMFNPDDFALATGTIPIYGEANWEENQRISKPDDPFGVGQYYYHTYSEGSVSYTLTGTIRLVNDAHESMAFIARTRTKAVGAMGSVGGVISQEVNMGEGTVYDFKKSRSDHSAEFTRRVQKTQAFYQRMFDFVGATP